MPFYCIFVAPFPGACCLTCSMEFDPKVVLNYTSVETIIVFSFANVFYKRYCFQYRHALGTGGD